MVGRCAEQEEGYKIIRYSYTWQFVVFLVNGFPYSHRGNSAINFFQLLSSGKIGLHSGGEGKMLAVFLSGKGDQKFIAAIFEA